MLREGNGGQEPILSKAVLIKLDMVEFVGKPVLTSMSWYDFKKYSLPKAVDLKS